MTDLRTFDQISRERRRRRRRQGAEPRPDGRRRAAGAARLLRHHRRLPPSARPTARPTTPTSPARSTTPTAISAAASVAVPLLGDRRGRQRDRRSPGSRKPSSACAARTRCATPSPAAGRRSTPSGPSPTARNRASPTTVWRWRVVVQRLVEAEVAGVLFTRDPLDPEGRQMLVEASWGLGESRRLRPRHAGSLSPRPRHRRRPSTGTSAQGGDGDRRRRAARPRRASRATACLDDAAVGATGGTGPQGRGVLRRRRATSSGPMADGRFWLLQARPITVASAAERETGAARRDRGAGGAGRAGRHRLGEVQPGRGAAGADADDVGDRAPLHVRPRRLRADVPRPRLRPGPVPGRRRHLRPRLRPAVLQPQPRGAHALSRASRSSTRSTSSRPTRTRRCIRRRASIRSARLAFLAVPAVHHAAPGHAADARRSRSSSELARTFAAGFPRRASLPPFDQAATAALRQDLTELDAAGAARPVRTLDRADARRLRPRQPEADGPGGVADGRAGSEARPRARRRSAPRRRCAISIMGVHPDADSDLPGAVRDLAAGQDEPRDEFLEPFGHRGSHEMELSLAALVGGCRGARPPLRVGPSCRVLRGRPRSDLGHDSSPSPS